MRARVTRIGPGRRVAVPEESKHEVSGVLTSPPATKRWIPIDTPDKKVPIYEWGLLRLTSCFTTVGWSQWTEDRSENEEVKRTMAIWGGHVIALAHDGSLRTAIGPEPAPFAQDKHPKSSAAGSVDAAGESAPDPKNNGPGEDKDDRDHDKDGAGAGPEEDPDKKPPADLEQIRRLVRSARSEDIKFFESLAEDIGKAEPTVGMASATLSGAEVALNDFEVSDGDVAFLQAAYDSGMKAFVLSKNDLDTRLIGAVLAAAAGYVRRVKTESPAKGKDFLIRGPLKSIVRTLSPLWMVGSSDETKDVEKVMVYLLDLLSCVHLLPPASIEVLPSIDQRIIPVIGLYCSRERATSWNYPIVGECSVRALLRPKTLLELCLISRDLSVDITPCESKSDVIKALMESGTNLSTALGATPTPPPPPPEPEAPPTPPPSPRHGDKDVLLSLYQATEGEKSWKVRDEWDSKADIEEWYGVEMGDVDHGKAVLSLTLENNNLSGTLPVELGNFAAIKVLDLDSNDIGGEIPMELCGVVSLEKLILRCNKLSGPIPPEICQLSNLKILNLRGNRLTGPIPPQMGTMSQLTEIWLYNNNFSGALPKELGELTKLTKLVLNDNSLFGRVPQSYSKLTSLVMLRLNNNSLSLTKSKMEKLLPRCKDMAL